MKNWVAKTEETEAMAPSLQAEALVEARYAARYFYTVLRRIAPLECHDARLRQQWPWLEEIKE